MAIAITKVKEGSPAARLGIRPGMRLLAVNGHDIRDVLDYGFYTTASALRLELAGPDGRYTLEARKEEYEELGIESESFLMDKQHSCANKCIFCFIDQLPRGLRDTLYFKDDDERLSFLFGNYITLTNLGDEEIGRIIEMKVSPVNISVHTTDPDLRCRMMNNRFAGDKLRYLYRLAEAGTEINCQIVLCPGWNDGRALEQTLADLTALYPSVRSIACVPVGLTAYREGLEPLHCFDRDSAAAVLDCVGRANARCKAAFGVNLVYPADEFFLTAGRPIPPIAYYDELLQLENGVGMLAELFDEFGTALADRAGDAEPRTAALVTGELAAPSLRALCARLGEKYPGLRWEVYPVRNDFFGGNVSVSGLVTAQDIVAQLRGKAIAAPRLLFPDNMLRREGDLFLDSLTPADVERELGLPLRPVSGGADLIGAILGE